MHEIKFDGYRCRRASTAATIRLLTRNGLDWTERFRTHREALEELGLGSALIDGEVVVEDAQRHLRASARCRRT